MVRQSRAPILLLTRPAPQSQRFAAEIRAVVGQIEVVISPLMQTVHLQPVVPDRPYRAVILSSETGAEAAARLVKAGNALPRIAFCVGDRTADAARKAGFQAVSAQGDARDLLALVLDQMPSGPLLHLRGENTTGDLAISLTERGVQTDAATVYGQRALPLLPQALRLFAQDQPLLIPVFSPRSAALLVQAAPISVTAPLWIAAISVAAARAAEPLSPARLVISSRPDGETMLQAVAGLLHSNGNA